MNSSDEFASLILVKHNIVGVLARELDRPSWLREYVAVPPESNPKSKFSDAFNLPADKFAAQYGYGISTIDWSKAGADGAREISGGRCAARAGARAGVLPPRRPRRT